MQHPAWCQHCHCPRSHRGWQLLLQLSLSLATVAAVELAAATAAGTPLAQPCALRHVTRPTLVVLGGDDAGTAAAYSAAKLGVATLLVLTHRRDLGGDPTSFYHDGGRVVRNGGGLNQLLLDSAPQPPGVDVSNTNVRGGPGGAFLFFDTLLRTAPINSTLEIIDGYLALAGSGEVGTGPGTRGCRAGPDLRRIHLCAYSGRGSRRSPCSCPAGTCTAATQPRGSCSRSVESLAALRIWKVAANCQMTTCSARGLKTP